MKRYIKYLFLILMAFVSMFISSNKVWALERTVDSSMSLEDINSVVSSLASGDTLIITEGNYGFKTSDGVTSDDAGKNYHKAIVLETNGINVVLSGTYTRFQLIVKADDTTVTLGANTILNGEASTTHNTAAAFAIQSGTLDINTGDYTLSIVDYNNGVRMGYNSTSNSGILTIASGSRVDIDTYYSKEQVLYEETYYDSYNDHGDAGVCGYTSPTSWYCDGAVGSGIYTRGSESNHIINVMDGATLNIHDSSNSGIYLGYDNKNNKINKVTINVTNATLNSTGNKGVALFEDGWTPIFQLNAVNSTINFSNNGSNGITGHTTGTNGNHNSIVYLDNSKLHLDNNHAMGANNTMFYLKNKSYLSCINAGSHGLTNIALMMYDSTLEVDHAVYRGVNINRNYENMPTTINNSYVTVKNCGQSGLYLLNSKGTIFENNSHITTNGNGTTNPASTFSGDGIVASYNVTFVNSYLTSTDFHAISTSETSAYPSTIYIKEYMVAVAQGSGESDGRDIIEDTCSSTDLCKTYTGTVVITGGSLDASSDVTVYNYEDYINNREDISSSVKVVNDENEDLYRFNLHSNINVEVGGEGQHEFVYQYKNGNTLTYKFIYDESGNAYVWTPISILHYDATEGLYINSDTALKLEDRFGKDITIYGNSLNLAERSLASAVRDGYVFLGWFIADDQELAAYYAEMEDFDSLYSLLNTPFDASVKLELDGKAVSELTVYAKWVKVKDEISKEGDSSVSDPSDAFNYDIKYSAKIEGYVSDVTIIIKDTLEFAIDEAKSNISNDKTGITLSDDYDYEVESIYDSTNKTITWVIRIKDVKASFENPLMIQVNKKIKLYYIDIDNSVVEVKNTVSASVSVNGSIVSDPLTDEVITPILYKGGDEVVEVLPPQTGIDVQSKNLNVLYVLLLIGLICLGKVKSIYE